MGLECGPCRPPLASLTQAPQAQLSREFVETGCWERLQPKDPQAGDGPGVRPSSQVIDLNLLDGLALPARCVDRPNGATF